MEQEPANTPRDGDRASQIELVVLSCIRRRMAGESVDVDQVIAEYDYLMPELEAHLRAMGDSSPISLAQSNDSNPGISLDGSPSAITLETDAGSSGAADRPSDTGSSDQSMADRVRLPGYKIKREVSRGGQAVVLEAKQESTGQRVAIKLIHNGPFASESQRERMEREVQVLTSVQHPNVVPIIDRGQTGDGTDYFVMRYIDGEPLDAWLKRQHRAKSDDAAPADPRDTLPMFIKICAAVEVAHRNGVVHRDLKPSNVRIDPNGEPYVLDFGLAHSKLSTFSSQSSDGPLTVTGQFLGSLPWASPEQAEGKPDLISARTDVYALGVILYQVLTGEFPYEVVGSMRDVLDNIMRVDPTPPSRVMAARLAKRAQDARRWRLNRDNPISEDIEAVVLRALAKDPYDRYATAGELGDDINRYLAGQRPHACDKPRSRPRPAGRDAARPSAAMLAMFLLPLVALVGVAIWALTQGPKGQPTPPTPQGQPPAGTLAAGAAVTPTVTPPAPGQKPTPTPPQPPVTPPSPSAGDNTAATNTTTGGPTRPTQSANPDGPPAAPTTDPASKPVKPATQAGATAPADAAGPAPLLTATDPHRAAAQRVIELGGYVSVRTESGANRKLTKSTGLPDESFQITVLNLSQNTQVTDADLQPFKDIRSLNLVYLMGTHVGDKGIEALCHSKGITLLDIRSTDVGDAGLAHVANLTKLGSIEMNGTLVTDEGLRHLSNLTTLYSVRIAGCAITDKGMAHLANLTRLSDLVVSGTAITDASMPIIGSFKRMGFLTLSSTGITDAGLAHLKDCTRIGYLHLDGTRISDAGLKHIEGMVGMKQMMLSGTGVTDAGIESLTKFKTLNLVYLSRTRVTDQGKARLREALPGCKIY